MNRWSWIFPSCNSAAIILAALMVLLLLSSASTNRLKLRILFFVLLAPCMFFLQATGSRAGMCALFLSCSVLFFLKAIDWKNFLGLFLLALFIWILPYLHIGVPQLSLGKRMGDLDFRERSMGSRFEIWYQSFSVIYDHFWFGVGRDGSLMPLMDTWYLPADIRYRVGTLLNETLTFTAYWGVIALAITTTTLGLIIGNGITAVRNNKKLAAAGIGVLIVVFFGGQFQTHLFSSANWGTGSWLLGILLVLVGVWKSWSKKSSLIGMGIGFSYALIIIICSLSFGDAEWTVRHEGDQMIAFPRYGTTKRILLIAGARDVSDEKALMPWLEARIKAKDAVVLISKENPRIPKTLQNSQLPCIVIASGEHTEQIGELAWQGKFRGVPVILCDPEKAPSFKGKKIGKSKITIKIARASLFVPTQSCKTIAEQTEGVEFELISGGSAAWWWKCP